MRITCDHCQAKYTIADEKIQGRTVKIRCRKCGGDIVVHGTPETNDANPSFQVSISESDERTMSLTEVLAALSSGLIHQDTFVWADGFADWKPIREVPAIMSQLPERESESIAVGEDGTEALRAAVLKRDDERSTRDLFGNPLEVEAAPPKSLPPADIAKAAPPADALTLGQRGENSVLFSLATLGPSIERSKTPPPPAVAATPDDSGIIDINALLPSKGEPRAMAAAIPSALFGPPVLEPAPVAAATPTASGGRSRMVIVGGAAAVLVLGGIGLFLQSQKAPTATPTDVAPPAVSATPAPTVAPAPVEPPPAASAAPTPPPVVQPEAAPAKPSSKPAAGHAHASPAANRPSKQPTTAPAAKPAKSGGCAKCSGDDLMCQIRCSAGK